MRISIYFCWQWSGKVAIGWPYSPDGIQHLTPNKCLKYLGRKSVGLSRLNPTLRISIHHCWLWSGKVAIGWPYSPDGIQHLTPNKCLKYLGRKSVGLSRLNPTLRISIHHCWLWSGKVAIGWPYSPDGIQHLTPKLRVTLRGLNLVVVFSPHLIGLTDI